MFAARFGGGKALLIHKTGIVADVYIIEQRGDLCAVRHYSELVFAGFCSDALAYIEAALKAAERELASFTAVEGRVHVVKTPGVREIKTGSWGRLYKGALLAAAYDLERGALVRPGHEGLIRL